VGGLVVWLHILLGPYWRVCSALFGMTLKNSEKNLTMKFMIVSTQIKIALSLNAYV
jgi:hypothetical protein